MNEKNKHSPDIVRFSKHENLLDFGFKKQTKKFFKKYEKDSEIEFNSITWLNLLNILIVMLEWL